VFSQPPATVADDEAFSDGKNLAGFLIKPEIGRWDPKDEKNPAGFFDALVS